MASPRYTYQVPEAVLVELDAIVAKLGPLATRPRVLRLALERGLAALREELGLDETEQIWAEAKESYEAEVEARAQVLLEENP